MIKKIISGIIMIMTVMSINPEIINASQTTGWIQVGLEWKYKENGKFIEGWKQIDGDWYFFNSVNKMAKGITYIGSENKIHVFDDNGKWLREYISNANAVTNGTTIQNKNSDIWYYNLDTEKWTHEKGAYNYVSIRGSNITTDSKERYEESLYTAAILNVDDKAQYQVPDEKCDYGHSISEVVNKWQQLKPKFNDANIFEEEPSIKAPYKAGKVKNEYLNDTLNYLNFARYLAYLNPVKLDSNLNMQAQYGAVLTTANNKMEHTNPSKPVDMKNNFFEVGRISTSSSNLCGGKVFESLEHCLNDNNNLMGSDNIGHREWLLDPKVTTIGFGTTSSYSTQNLPFANFDKNVDKPDYIAWPSEGAFPNDFINRFARWSLNLNKDVYDIESDISVEVTRLCDNKKWNLNQVDKFSGYNSGFKILSNNSYGFGSESYTIIFHIGKNDLPVENYLGKYKVKISGLNKEIEYITNFFDLDK